MLAVALQTFQRHLSRLQDIGYLVLIVQSWMTISGFFGFFFVFFWYMFFRYFSFLFCHTAAFYSHVGIFAFFFCFPDNIFVPLMLSSLNSFKLLMVTIFNRPAHPLCSPVGVLQMGACSCLIDQLQKVAEWRFLTSFNMPVCRHAGNSLLSHMFRTQHTQTHTASSSIIR